MLKATFSRVFGRSARRDAPAEAGDRRRRCARASTALLALAACALLTPLVAPVWRMTLHAPQYPGGLRVRAYLDRLEGDVEEIDRLNHYIGMRPLGEAAKLEREVGGYAIVGMALLLVGAAFAPTRWAALLALPAFTFPAVFLADLAYWLREFGMNLDPRAPLSSSIEPFVPPVLGEGLVGQFRTVALPDLGLWFAFLASLLIAAGLSVRRRGDRTPAAQPGAPAVGASAAPATAEEGA